MIELPAMAWTAIGVVIGAIPAMSIAFWRECRERRIAKHQSAMQQLKDRQHTVRRGIERGYGFLLTDKSQALDPPDRG